MRANLKLVICLAICCSTIQALWIPSKDNPITLDIKMHTNLSRSFPCGVPQPRSYRIKDILPLGAVSTSETIVPPYTVIQRCDQGTGCCKEEQVCSPIPEKIYYINAEVILVDLTRSSPTSQPTKTLKIQQHGGCSCQNRTLRPTVVPDPVVTIME